MGIPLRNPDGKFAGSIGVGKNKVPTPAAPLLQVSDAAANRAHKRRIRLRGGAGPSRPNFFGAPESFEQALEYFNFERRPSPGKVQFQTWETDSVTASAAQKASEDDLFEMFRNPKTVEIVLLGALWNPIVTEQEVPPAFIYEIIRNNEWALHNVRASAATVVKLAKHQPLDFQSQLTKWKMSLPAEAQEYLAGDISGETWDETSSNHGHMIVRQMDLAGRADLSPDMALSLTRSKIFGVTTKLIRNNAVTQEALIALALGEQDVVLKAEVAKVVPLPQTAAKALLKLGVEGVNRNLATNPSVDEEIRVMAAL